MTKYQLSRPGAPWDYPTLGFTATADGAILDGTLFTPDLEIPPDVYWDVYVGGDPETDVTRYATPSTDYLNPVPESTEGSLLLYSRTANQYVQTLPTDAVDPETPFGAALVTAIDVATLPILEGPLGRWKGLISVTPETAKVAFLGDSTSDPVTSFSRALARITGLHTQQGEALSGVGAASYYTDGVANGTTTFTSATAAFTSADVGRFFHGQGVPNATTIASVTNSTTVVLTNSVPSGTARKFWVGRHIIGGGNNGMALSYWMANPNFTSGFGRYNQTALLADAPDLIVASWLINDIRQGALGLTVSACVTAGAALLEEFIDWVRTNLPDTDILLRMPNALLTENVSTLNFVDDGAGNINPAGLAQIYSTALRRIYLSFVGRYPNVDVIDTQGNVFGTRSRDRLTSDPLMVDQLHPSSSTSSDVDLMVPVGGGYVRLADSLAERIGFARNAFPLEDATRIRHELILYSAPGSGVMRLISRDYDSPASQISLTTSDQVYVNGINAPGAITSSGIDRVVGTNFMQLTITGSTDYTPYIGQTVTIFGTHGPSGATERMQIYVDVPAVGAGSDATLNVTVPGVRIGNNGKAVGYVACPGSGFTGQTNVRIVHQGVTGDDEVRFRLNNVSGSTVDLAGESWTFWLVR